MIFFLAKLFKTISSSLSFFLLYFFASKESLGYYSYWYAYILFFGVFIRFNSGIFVLRFKDKFKTLYFSFFLIQLFIVLVISFGSFSFLPFKIWSVSLFLFIVLLFETWESYFYVVKDYKIANNYGMVISLILILLKIYFLLFFRDHLLDILLVIFPLDFSLGLFLYIFKGRKQKVYLKTSFFLVKNIFVYIFPFFINTALMYLTGKIDYYLITRYLNLEELGNYSLAYKLYEGAFILQAVFGTIVISKYNSTISSLNFESENFVFFLKRWIYPCLLIPFFLLALFFLDFDKIVAGILDFEDIDKIILIFYILLSGIVFNFFGVLMNKIAFIHGFYKEILIINFIALILNIILNIIFLPVYGILSAAFITVLSQFFSYFLLFFLFSRTREIIKFFLRALFNY